MTVTIPIWLALIAPPVFGIIGFLACACLTAGKVSDDQGDYESAAHWQALWRHALDTSIDNAAAHSRAASLASAKEARIDRALEQVTPGANATVQRIARILKGEA
ncbi:hypothetical protein [Sphingopyxis sp. C-1]|uniref:hypothetical protein n=1 Tax=Sphingopyxis sp. C-1 TaxID=262667 RepID=UPI0006C2DD5B|nr:hypothetical protein [Sphingopyxis sp. C-1]GAO78671.1 hypothetical protein SC1_01980 [Sphingopyxis sp. C-1]